jgi:hypothetical protein
MMACTKLGTKTPSQPSRRKPAHQYHRSQTRYVITPKTSIREIIHHTNCGRPALMKLGGSHNANDPRVGGKESNMEKSEVHNDVRV